MLPNVYHTLALTKIRRIQKLSGRGDIIVKVGQKIAAGDKIADIYPSDEFQAINVKKLLNLNNSQDARRSVELEEGRRIRAGDIIAEAGGVMKKSIKAEKDSEVILINGNLVLLKIIHKPEPMYAGFNAIVTEIMPNFGVELEINGALIQGVWSNQKIASGVLYSLAETPESELLPKMLEVSHRGSVIMGAYCKNPNVLKNAQDLPVKGMILASMHPDLIPLALAAPFPIILIEGFSPAPMNLRAFDLINSNVKREVSLSGIYSQAENERPEIIIPLPADADLPPEHHVFKEGQVVRVNQGHHQGKAGIIRRIVNNTVTLFNGVKTICAVVQFTEEEQASIPLANLDILE